MSMCCPESGEVFSWWHVFPDGSEPGAGVEAEEWNESGSSTEPETTGTELFWLDYQADSGRLTSFIVHKVRGMQEMVQLSS